MSSWIEAKQEWKLILNVGRRFWDDIIEYTLQSLSISVFKCKINLVSTNDGIKTLIFWYQSGSALA